MMKAINELPWDELSAFILENGNVRVPRNFYAHFVEKVERLIPYDQARIYFINDNDRVYDTMLYRADSKWMDMYFQYYANLEDGRYSLSRGFPTNSTVSCRSFDWSKSSMDEFIADYIKPQGIRHNLTVFFHDERHCVKALCTFERGTYSGYKAEEIMIMRMLQAHLDNLHKNLLSMPEQNPMPGGIDDAKRTLTQRENEITQLVCKGANPSSIAKKLGISLSTVYRHIANIYKKLNISSMQELMLLSGK